MKPLQEKMNDVKELLQSMIDNLEAQTELLQKIYEKLPDKEIPEKDESENKDESETKKQICEAPEQSS